jgi:hypothetical protein
LEDADHSRYGTSAVNDLVASRAEMTHHNRVLPDAEVTVHEILYTLSVVGRGEARITADGISNHHNQVLTGIVGQTSLANDGTSEPYEGGRVELLHERENVVQFSNRCFFNKVSPLLEHWGGDFGDTKVIRVGESSELCSSLSIDGDGNKAIGDLARGGVVNDSGRRGRSNSSPSIIIDASLPASSVGASRGAGVIR